MTELKYNFVWLWKNKNEMHILLAREVDADMQAYYTFPNLTFDMHYVMNFFQGNVGDGITSDPKINRDNTVIHPCEQLEKRTGVINCVYRMVTTMRNSSALPVVDIKDQVLVWKEYSQVLREIKKGGGAVIYGRYFGYLLMKYLDEGKIPFVDVDAVKLPKVEAKRPEAIDERPAKQAKNEVIEVSDDDAP